MITETIPPVFTPSTIVLKGDLGHNHKEITSDGNILPGQLIQRQSDMGVVVHATSGGSPGEILVAKEDGLRGMTIDGHYNNGLSTGGYVAGDVVLLHGCQPGDVMNMRLGAGTGYTAVYGSKLASNGDGNLKIASGSDVVLFQALAALDLSGVGAVPTFLTVVKV